MNITILSFGLRTADVIRLPSGEMIHFIRVGYETITNKNLIKYIIYNHGDNLDIS